jgi:hypothetical protein
MYYDDRKGYGLQFGENFIIYKDSQREIIRTADYILLAIVNFSLLDELNNMQMQAHANDEVMEGDTLNRTVFDNKFEIPSYFINLILKDYNMKVLGW